MTDQTPSQAIVAGPSRSFEVVDSRGRKLSCRRLRAFEQAKIFAAAGADNADNGPFMGLAIAACTVVGIDGFPYQMPTSLRDIYARLEVVDDEGLVAIQNYIEATSKSSGTDGDYAKN